MKVDRGSELERKVNINYFDHSAYFPYPYQHPIVPIWPQVVAALHLCTLGGEEGLRNLRTSWMGRTRPMQRALSTSSLSVITKIPRGGQTAGLLADLDLLHAVIPPLNHGALIRIRSLQTSMLISLTNSIGKDPT